MFKNIKYIMSITAFAKDPVTGFGRVAKRDTQYDSTVIQDMTNPE